MAGFSWKLEGFDKLADALDPAKFPRRFRKHVKRATEANAMLGASQVQRAIYKGVPPKNAPLTAALKGSSRTLVDSGALAGSISGKAADWNEATISANRRARARKGRRGKKPSPSSANVAAILYYGATVKVTDKMRRLFFAMAREYEAKGRRRKGERGSGAVVRPLKPSTKVIVIPPRRYMDAATSDPMRRKYQSNWLAAVRLAMLGVK